MESPRIRWNRVAILIGIAAVLLLVCLGAWAFTPRLRQVLLTQYWKTDSQLASQVAHSMIDYQLPANYQEARVFVLQGVTPAVIIAHRERPGDMIYIGELQAGILDVEAWRTRYEESLSKEMADRRYIVQTTATQQSRIRGQPVTLRLLEGTDENGNKVRQVVCGFSGKNSDLLMAIVASKETWDQAMVDGFLQSIR